MTYHRDMCHDLFGHNLFPDTEATNTYYGGADIQGSRIFFLNSSQGEGKIHLQEKKKKKAVEILNVVVSFDDDVHVFLSLSLPLFHLSDLSFS